MPGATNADIIREVKQVQESNKDMLVMIKDHEARIRPLENFVIAYDAALKAVQGVNAPRSTTLNKDFVNIVLRFITLLTAMVGLTYLIVSQINPR